MLLAIEQGNTNTLFAIHNEGRWIAHWRAATDDTNTMRPPRSMMPGSNASVRCTGDR